MPRAIFIVSVNGAGKTSFALKFLEPYKDKMHFLNADEIARGLAPHAPESQAMAA